MSETQQHPSDWNRVKQIFHETRELHGPERERLLGVLCGGDAALRAQVQILLAADRDEGPFLDARTVDRAGAAARAAAEGAGSEPPEAPGKHIGPYKLLQRIGEGGFGVVYMAEQEEPIRRQVALKVIKPGMDTKQVIARFEAERQALAMLDHPNIAKVLDAGATPAGRPYFVMELVRGIPITDYCDEERLGPRERLELFAQVCTAVHHAHENGIIHRDIKPSNVMVTLHDGTAVPKVIDFGVAKAIRQKLTEATLFTEYNQFIGTPEYMAPEQAAYAGLDVDRRSDVYSLGALLYELLTGTTPFEARKLRRAAHLEVLRILKEEEPPKPSTRVHTMGKSSEPLAKDRRTDASGLARLLRGDLDWIVMKALEKDRGRRYESAADLATDIGRYFEQRPIEARPPSFGYRAQKLVKRRRGPFAAAAVIALLVVGDVAYVGWQRSRMAAETAALGAMGDQRTELLLSSSEGGESCFFDSGRPSPDGGLIALVDFCWGGVHVHDVEAGTTRRVTDNDYYEGVAWSSDGRTIMASVGVPPSLRLIDVETGASESPASIAGQSLIPTAWSPDADHFSARREDDDGQLLTVLGSLVTGKTEVVGVGGGGASFSPDGRWMVFAAVPEGEERRDLFVVDVTTGVQRPLTEGPTDERTPIWSPDGRTILYSSESGMWAIPVRDGRPAGPVELLRGDAVTPNAWTRRGLYFTVANTVGRTHRIEVDPATGQPTGNLSAADLPSGHFPNATVAWAPDGQRLAVVGWSDGSLRVFDGGSSQSFPLDLRIPSNLWWGEDGRDVLFTMSDDYRPTTVSALDVNTGEVRELFSPIPGIRQVHVSSDLTRMLYIRRSEPVADGSRERELVVSPVGDPAGSVIAGSDANWVLARHFGQPAFSPDGSKIAFLRHGRGGIMDVVPYSLWVVDADGTDERLLVGEPFQIRPPVWDPTGRMVAYKVVDLEEERVRLMVMSVEDGKQHEIWSFRDLEGSTKLQEWSRDGTWIGVTESVGRWELWVNRDLPGGGG